MRGCDCCAKLPCPRPGGGGGRHLKHPSSAVRGCVAAQELPPLAGCRVRLPPQTPVLDSAAVRLPRKTPPSLVRRSRSLQAKRAGSRPKAPSRPPLQQPKPAAPRHCFSTSQPRPPIAQHQPAASRHCSTPAQPPPLHFRSSSQHPRRHPPPTRGNNPRRPNPGVLTGTPSEKHATTEVRQFSGRLGGLRVTGSGEPA